MVLYKGLVEVSALINSITDSGELLSAILDVARRVMRAEASSLFLADGKTGKLELTIARGSDTRQMPIPVEIPRGKGIVGWVHEHRKSVLVSDAYQDPRFYPELDHQSGFKTRSVMAVPLFQDDQELGALEVLNPSQKDAFDQLDLEAFEAYGNLVATAIRKLRLIERERDQLQLAKDLVLATEIQPSFLPDILPSTHLLSLAALFLLLRAEFVAAAQVVVYAGAVMVLYVFVVAYVGGPSTERGQRDGGSTNNRRDDTPGRGASSR